MVHKLNLVGVTCTQRRAYKTRKQGKILSVAVELKALMIAKETETEEQREKEI